MTASDDFRPERFGEVDDRPDGYGSGAGSEPASSATPSRSDFPVRRGAGASRGPVSRDEGLVGGRARFRSDRHRTWAARRDILPGGRPVQVVAGDGADDVPPPLPDDLRVDRLEVVHDSTPAGARPPTAPDPVPRTRVGWPAAPLPPTVAVPGTAQAPQPVPQPAQPGHPAQPGRQTDRYSVGYPAERAAAATPPVVRSMPPSVGRGDGSITRADLADLLPRQAGPEAGATPPPSRSTGRRAAAGPVAGAPAAPLDDLMPHPERVPYGVDLPTSADELFPPSTRQAPPDLLRRKPAGTSTGLQPRIFAPGTGTDESSLPVLVGDPVADQRPAPADGVRRFDLAGGAAAPARPDPRLPLRPAPPADLDVARVWGSAPQPAGAVGPSTGPLAAVTMPAPAPRVRQAAPAAPPAVPSAAVAGPMTGAMTGGAAARPAPAFSADVSDLATLFGPRPVEGESAAPGQAPVRVGHARRPSAAQPARRGWMVPTVTAALGLVAGIVFASSGEPAATPTPAKTVFRTVTVAPTP